MRFIICFAIEFMFMLGMAAAQQVQFNYNGRVNVMGVPFNGEGQFKLAITNYDGTITFWANDGMTLDGNEPTTAMTMMITDGFFSIDVGDTKISGMAAISSSIFNGKDDVYLRAWFNDGDAGFERLLPDRKVVNPLLLGLFNSEGEITLYVDPKFGNDLNTGLTTETAKLTVQAAWDSIPPFIKRNVSIELLDGVYREHVIMSGKLLANGAKIHIVGNPTNPQAVLFTGSDLADDSTPIRQEAFYIVSQKDVVIEGICFVKYTYHSVFLDSGSNVKFEQCLFLSDECIGIHAIESSYMNVTNCEFVGPANWAALYATRDSRIFVTESYIRNAREGVGVAYQSSVSPTFTRFENCVKGIEAFADSLVQYPPALISGNEFKNCDIGTRLFGNCTTVHHVYNSYINVGLVIQSQNNSSY